AVVLTRGSSRARRAVALQARVNRRPRRGARARHVERPMIARPSHEVRPYREGDVELDALSLLKTDHDKVKKLLAEHQSTTESGVKTREELFATIKAELTVHEV